MNLDLKLKTTRFGN